MKQTLKRLSAIILAICLVVGTAVAVSAVSPNKSYAYWYDVSNTNKAVYSKAMYQPTLLLDAKEIGVEAFTKINNICTDKKDNLYILDDASRIVILDKNFKLIREIGLIGEESYEAARSIYVNNSGDIYVCDTDAARILKIKSDGTLIKTVTLPDSPLIPDDFEFRPIKIVEDKYGYLYVLSEGSYYGALLYDEKDEFLGFYGANTVNATIGTVFTNIKNRLFPNNEKLSKVTKKLPFSFVDLVIDDEGFIYTCNGYTGPQRGEIRKLSPGAGTDILGSSSVKFTDTVTSYVNIPGKVLYNENLIEISVDGRGFMYCLESQHGKVFMYDQECRTLNVFGGGAGEGTQMGIFQGANGLALMADGDRVLVSDSILNNITVFDINSFGSRVKTLDDLTINGHYEQIKEGWEEILLEDANFQPAYSGLARAYLDEFDYDNAIKYAKIGYDRDTYAVAFEYVRKQFISDNFILIFIVLIVVVIGAIVLLVLSSKRKFNIIKNQELRLMLTTAIHPSNNFTDIKEKKLGSIPLCLLNIVLFYVVTVLQTLAGGFLFTVYDPASFNSLWVLVRTVGLVVLWIVANWLVCTLMGGKGKLKEIIVVTCYSLTPIIVAKIIRLILSNVLLPTEASFLGILDTIAMLYFGMMLIIGLLKIHDFTMTRLVGTSALSVAGIAAIVFLLIMIIILIQQFSGFITTVVSELLTL